MATQIFDGTGGKSVLQVMVAGTVGVLVCFNALEHLIIIGSFIKAVDEVKAFGADNSMCRPTDIKIRIAADGSERSVLGVADPERATAVRVAGSEAQAGELCLAFSSGAMVSPSATGSSSGQTGVKVFWASISKEAIYFFSGNCIVNPAFCFNLDLL